MSGKTLACKVHRKRGEEVPVEEGASLSLAVPEKRIKDTKQTLVWEDQLGDVPVVFKTYGQRNYSSWLESKFFRGRCEREFDRLEILYDAGVNTCEPLMVARGKDAEHGRFEVIGTRKIPYAVQLKEFLNTRPGADLQPLFKTIREMHHAGIYHGSLTLNNIVVSDPPNEFSEFYVLDLPRAIDFPYDLANSKMAWYDLIHFIHRVSEAVDAETLKPVFDLYPFSDPQRGKVDAFLTAYKPSKSLRAQLRSEFNKTARRSYRLGIPDAAPYKN